MVLQEELNRMKTIMGIINEQSGGQTVVINGSNNADLRQKISQQTNNISISENINDLSFNVNSTGGGSFSYKQGPKKIFKFSYLFSLDEKELRFRIFEDIIPKNSTDGLKFEVINYGSVKGKFTDKKGNVYDTLYYVFGVLGIGEKVFNDVVHNKFKTTPNPFRDQ